VSKYTTAWQLATLAVVGLACLYGIASFTRDLRPVRFPLATERGMLKFDFYVVIPLTDGEWNALKQRYPSNYHATIIQFK